MHINPDRVEDIEPKNMKTKKQKNLILLVNNINEL